MKEWLEVAARLEKEPDDWSLLADAFVRHGCNSSVQSSDPPSITGYLEAVEGSDVAAHELAKSLISLGAAGVDVRMVPDQDWAEIWKQHFKPTRIGHRYVVVPSWEEFESGPEDVILRLDPGQAFGTGEHPTTRLCLELLERALGLAGEPLSISPSIPTDESKPLEVLDLGCGSGILAIASAKAGAMVTATDIEPSAVEIARANAAQNGVELELFSGEGFGDWAAGRTWDLVVSNIISATLIRLAPSAARFVRAGGVWIVSGVLESNWREVREATERAGFGLLEDRREDDWVGAAFERVGGSP